jgi:hypothetical protein
VSATQPITLAGKTLETHRHVCAFFGSPEEEYDVLMPFIREGFDRGEKAFHIVDPSVRAEHRRVLEASGLPAAAAEQSGQLEVRAWQEAYLRDGHFDQDRMIALIQEILDEGKKKFPLTRLVAHMEWSLEDRPGVNDLVEYETRLNYVLPKYEDPVVCTYSTTKHSGGIVMDIMRTHPAVLIGGIFMENPFYVPPDQFLDELKRRKSA